VSPRRPASEVKPPPRPRGRRPGVEVDPEAIRQARLEAGLTLAEVAGSELSRQAVQRIEAGRVRPSMRTLEIIAGRVGSPVSALLARPTGQRPVLPREWVDDLATLCHTHQYERAVAVGETILEWRPQQRQEALARHYLGVALVRLNRPREALDQLVAARDLFEGLSDPWLVAETMDWEACALYLLRDPRSLQLVQEALSWYRALEPRSADTESRILEHVGMVLLWHHEWDRVIDCFQEALAMPGVVRDFARMGRIYHGLGVAHDHLGEYDRAADVLRSALVLYRQEHELTTGAGRAWLARVENELGLVLAHLGEHYRAEHLIRSSLERASQAGLERERSHFLLSLGELLALQDRTADAFEVLREGIEVGRAAGELTSVGQGYMQSGQLHARQGDRRQANRCFEQAVAAFERSGYPNRLEECRQAWAATRHGK
jgi:tetratricopeptide (TPR) repeat protein